MSRKSIKSRSLIFRSLCIIPLLIACVNEIESEVSPGDTPISFSMKVNDTNTRVTDTAFDKGDKIGLFATFSSKLINEERYIDNLKLEYNKSSSFIPEQTVFYPVGDVELDFYSYYPYQATGIPTNTSTIPISVQADQSDVAKRSQSDFLVAKAHNIESSEDPVELEFEHKLIKLQITLTPKVGEKINDLLNANPHIIATGFKTKANYNLDTDKITNTSEDTDITPYGTWSIKNGKLVGKEIIIIPQTINSEIQSFIMDWNGQIYTCPMPELTLEASTQCALDITTMQTTSHLLTGVISTIKEWKTVEGKETNNGGKTTAVHIAALSFSQSDVYRIYNEGKVIAEICKEYLKSDDINSRAIITYPVGADEKSDLSQGTVLKLLDDETNINGGTISWDTENNSFAYASEDSKPIDIFYFNEAGEVLLEKPKNPIDIKIISHTVQDTRGGDLKEYPIVKIGTQYWMKENLQATMYRDGSTTSKITTFTQGAGYFHPAETNTYFYNREAFIAKELAPEHWRIPTLKDWKSLIKYIDGMAILLKVGEWKTSTDVYTGTGETGFNAIPYGVYNNKSGKAALANVGSSAGYWISGESGSGLVKEVILLSTAEIVEPAVPKSEDIALFARCIKE